MSYDDLELKKPIESDDYEECSSFVVYSIENIMKNAMDSGKNKIIINTNLKLGIPMENVNKIAGPFIEAWAFERFHDALEDENNTYQLMNVEAGERLNGYELWLKYAEKYYWIK